MRSIEADFLRRVVAGRKELVPCEFAHPQRALLVARALRRLGYENLRSGDIIVAIRDQVPYELRRNKHILRKREQVLTEILGERE